jgi:2-oxoglutarate ferredoxin oxidoreductase subunit beta
MGQFVHVIRRNLNMVYIVMNNGCYGLTKGQDSATADDGSVNKSGNTNLFSAIDLAGLAVELGATFVAQSFSGDKKQLTPLIKAAIAHPGFAFINVISPCVTFNNNKGSTKSYDYVREHVSAIGSVDFVPERREITASYAEGSTRDIKLHDGSWLRFSKLDQHWDPFDRLSTMNALHQARQRNEILTGLLYMDQQKADLHALLKTPNVPLNTLTEKELCPGSAALKDINAGLR